MRGQRLVWIGVLAAILAAVMWRLATRTPPATPPALSAVPTTWTPVTAGTLAHGRFKHLNVYAPHGTARGFVLFLSGADGWTPTRVAQGSALAAQGALVVGIDTSELTASLEDDGAACVFPDGDLENLSHFVQAYYHLPTYLSPLLVGEAAGATLAYATLAQAPANTFAAAVSLEFCPNFAMRKPLCKGSGVEFTTQTPAGVKFLPSPHLANPWIVIARSTANTPAASAVPADTGCSAETIARFTAQIPVARWITVPPARQATSTPTSEGAWPAAYAAELDRLLALNAPTSATTPDALKDLPLVAVPSQQPPAGAATTTATPSSTATSTADTFAIMLSGDGGWAGLDKEVAAALAAQGIPVIGLDSLRYFWSPRTPDGLAADLGRIITFYRAALGKQHVMIIGYSQGADVLPFAINRLSAASRAPVVLAAVMGMSEHALFEFHVSSWLADDNSGPATLPEVQRIAGMTVLCIYGEQEDDSLCPKLDAGTVSVVKLKGGHHFDGNYAGLAQTILAAARR